MTNFDWLGGSAPSDATAEAEVPTNPAGFLAPDGPEVKPSEPLDFLATPREVEGPVGFFEVLGGVDSSRIPIVGSAVEFADVGELVLAARRIQAGKGSEQDQQALDAWAYQQQRGMTFAGQVADIVLDVPKFAAEIFLSGGAVTAGKKVTKAGAKALLKGTLAQAVRVGAMKETQAKTARVLARLAAKKALRTTAGKVAAGTLAVGARVAALEVAGGAVGKAAGFDLAGGMISAAAANKAIGRARWEEDDFGRFQIQMDRLVPSTIDMLPQGFVDSVIQVGTELIGGHLVSGVSKGLAKLGVKEVPLYKAAQALQMRVIDKYLSEHSKATMRSVLELMERGGFNGIFGEYLEERAAGLGELFAKYALDMGEDFNGWDTLFPGFQRSLVELTAFAIPGTAVGGALAVRDWRAERAIKNANGLARTQMQARWAQMGRQDEFDTGSKLYTALLELGPDRLSTTSVPENPLDPKNFRRKPASYTRKGGELTTAEFDQLRLDQTLMGGRVWGDENARYVGNGLWGTVQDTVGEGYVQEPVAGQAILDAAVDILNKMGAQVPVNIFKDRKENHEEYITRKGWKRLLPQVDANRMIGQITRANDFGEMAEVFGSLMSHQLWSYGNKGRNRARRVPEKEVWGYKKGEAIWEGESRLSELRMRKKWFGKPAVDANGSSPIDQPNPVDATSAAAPPPPTVMGGSDPVAATIPTPEQPTNTGQGTEKSLPNTERLRNLGLKAERQTQHLLELAQKYTADFPNSATGDDILERAKALQDLATNLNEALELELDGRELPPEIPNVGEAASDLFTQAEYLAELLAAQEDRDYQEVIAELDPIAPEAAAAIATQFERSIEDARNDKARRIADLERIIAERTPKIEAMVASARKTMETLSRRADAELEEYRAYVLAQTDDQETHKERLRRAGLKNQADKAELVKFFEIYQAEIWKALDPVWVKRMREAIDLDYLDDLRAAEKRRQKSLQGIPRPDAVLVAEYEEEIAAANDRRAEELAFIAERYEKLSELHDTEVAQFQAKHEARILALDESLRENVATVEEDTTLNPEQKTQAKDAWLAVFREGKKEADLWLESRLATLQNLISEDKFQAMRQQVQTEYEEQTDAAFALYEEQTTLRESAEALPQFAGPFASEIASDVAQTAFLFLEDFSTESDQWELSQNILTEETWKSMQDAAQGVEAQQGLPFTELPPPAENEDAAGGSTEEEEAEQDSGSRFVSGRAATTLAVNGELATLGSIGAPGESGATFEHVERGFANFVRMWLVADGTQYMPATTEWFENTFSANHPEAYLAMTELRDMLRRFRLQGSSKRTFAAHNVDTSHLRKLKSLIETWRSPIGRELKLQEFQEAWLSQDKALVPVTRALEWMWLQTKGTLLPSHKNPWMMAESIRGQAPALAEYFATQGAMTWLRTKVPGVRPLNAVANLIGGKMEAFAHYLFVNRVLALHVDLAAAYDADGNVYYYDPARPNVHHRPLSTFKLAGLAEGVPVSDPRLGGLSQVDAKFMATRILAENPEFDEARRVVYEWWQAVLEFGAEASPTIARIVRDMRFRDPGDYVPLHRILESVEEVRKRRGSQVDKALGANVTAGLDGSMDYVENVWKSLLSASQDFFDLTLHTRVIDTILAAKDFPGMAGYFRVLPPDQVVAISPTIASVAKKLTDKLDEMTAEADAEADRRAGRAPQRAEGPGYAGHNIVKAFGNISEAIFGDQAKFLNAHLEFMTDASVPEAPNRNIVKRINAEGNWEFVEILDPALMRWINSGVTEESLWMAFKMMKWHKKMFTLGTTGSRLIFQLFRNPVRDFGTMIINTRTHYSALTTLPFHWLKTMGFEFMTSIWNPIAKATGSKELPMSEAQELYLRLGLAYSNELTTDSFYSREQAKKLTKEKGIRAVLAWDYIMEIMQSPERATRTNEVNLLARQMGEHGQMKTMQELTEEQVVDLVMAGKWVSTNFTSGGSRARAWNQIVPFFNAQIQGPRDTIRAIFDSGPEVRNMKILRAFTAYTIPGIMAWLAVRDLDWYKELTVQEKANSWYVPIPGTNHVLTWPLPFELGVAFSSIPVAFLDALYREDPQGMDWFLGDLVTGLSDAGTMLKTTVPSFIPPSLALAYEVGSNKKLYWQTPIVNQSLARLEKRAQYDEYSSHFSRWLGSKAKDMGAQEGWSPKMIDHLIQGVFGRMGLDLTKAVSGTDAAVGGGPAAWPIIGPQFKEKLAYPKSIRDLYDAYGERQRRFDSKIELESPAEAQVRLVMRDAVAAVSSMTVVLREMKSEARVELLAERNRVANEALAAHYANEITPEQREAFRASAKAFSAEKKRVREEQALARRRDLAGR